MRGISGNRLAWGILGSAVLVASAVGLTLAATAPSAPAASSPAVAAFSRSGGGVAPVTMGVASTGAVSPGSSSVAPSPVWCCSAGSPLGLTAIGQAWAPGAGTAARASAITRATTDAVRQARAAAQGAGISLGRIINVDVSVPGYPYPLPMGAAASAGIPSRTPAAPGANGAAQTSGPITTCPADSPCAYPGASTYATVTITWAIG